MKFLIGTAIAAGMWMAWPFSVQAPIQQVAEAKIESSYTIEELLDLYAKEYNADRELVHAIAWCESRKKNVENPYSSAGGVFQFIDTTWKAYCTGDKMNPEDNIACGVKLISERKLGHWLASADCWY